MWASLLDHLTIERAVVARTTVMPTENAQQAVVDFVETRVTEEPRGESALVVSIDAIIRCAELLDVWDGSTEEQTSRVPTEPL